MRINTPEVAAVETLGGAEHAQAVVQGVRPRAGGKRQHQKRERCEGHGHVEAHATLDC